VSANIVQIFRENTVATNTEYTITPK